MMRPATPGARLDGSPRVVIEDRCAPAILDRLLTEVEPFLKRSAAVIAADLPAAISGMVIADMVQEARITLWQIDLGRFPERKAAYLERILYTRMIDVYRNERRRGFTTGWSQHGRSVSKP